VGRDQGSVGFDWPDAPAVAEKVDEELMELREAMASGDRTHVEEELGDMLFAMSSLSRKLGIEPEAALRAANRKFMRRFAAMQTRLGESSADTATLDQMEAAWRDVKQTERE
jgi:ATP diphosphatase